LRVLLAGSTRHCPKRKLLCFIPRSLLGNNCFVISDLVIGRFSEGRFTAHWLKLLYSLFLNINIMLKEINKDYLQRQFGLSTGVKAPFELTRHAVAIKQQ